MGTTDGELVAVSPNGDIVFRTLLSPDSAVVSSPAVGSDNNIYIISVPKDSEKFWSSTLHSLVPSGGILWSVNFPTGFTTGSAKTVSIEGTVYVFVHITGVPYSQLVIFDGNGNEVHREDVCGAEITGGFPIPSDWWRVFTLGFPFEFRIPPPPDPLGPLYPTVAVADFPSSGQPIIIIADNTCGIRAYRWTPPNLMSNIWNQYYRRDINHSSPVVDPPNALVVVGRDDGHIMAYDLDTGTQEWDYDAGEPVTATPSIFVSRIYAISLQSLHAIDTADGRPTYKFALNGSSVASPALTANHLHVSSNTGFYTFSGFPEDPNSDIVLHGGTVGGFSSPAVGGDGTVYVVTSGGFLQAFPPRQ
jgi:hypothetical protein